MVKWDVGPLGWLIIWWLAAGAFLRLCERPLARLMCQEERARQERTGEGPREDHAREDREGLGN